MPDEPKANARADAMVGADDGASRAELDGFATWFEGEYDRLAARAERSVPQSPAPDADSAINRAIVRACGRYELAFVPAQFHHDAKLRKNEILALLVLEVARAQGHQFKGVADAREAVVHLIAQTADEEKVKASFGAAGAFLAPLLSPDIAKRAWKVYLKVPMWGKVALAGGVVTALVALPMVKPLSLGLLARAEFAA